MSRLPLNVERNIKSKIERIKCPTHGEYPKITFTQQSVNVSCCCEPFRKEVIAKCEQAVGEAIQEQITKAFKGLK